MPVSPLGYLPYTYSAYRTYTIAHTQYSTCTCMQVNPLGLDRKAVVDMRQPDVVMMKMTDKQKKRLAKQQAKNAALGIVADDSNDGAGTSKGAKKAAEKREKLAASVKRCREQLASDLKTQAEETARLRSRMGGRGFALGPVDGGTFSLQNPGGGADLLDDTGFIFVPGRKYGLIGRNGKGKSTLLKAVAARRVGGIDPAISVHCLTPAL